MIGTRAAAKWRTTFAREPSLSYAEAVFWIALRDVEKMDLAFAGPRQWDAEPPTIIDAMGGVHEEWGALWREANPRDQLAEALRLGDVMATGCRAVPMTHDQWAMQAREPIPTDLWGELTITDGLGRWENSTAALRPWAGKLHTMEAGWLNVRFDGETMRQAFPGPGMVSVYPGRPAN